MYVCKNVQELEMLLYWEQTTCFQQVNVLKNTFIDLDIMTEEMKNQNWSDWKHVDLTCDLDIMP